MANTEKIEQMAKEKSAAREFEILEYVDSELKKHHKVSFYSVSRDLKASKSFLYGNERIREAISKARQKETVSEKSKDTVIKALKFQVRKLEKEVERLEKAAAEREGRIAQLEKQLEAAYRY